MDQCRSQPSRLYYLGPRAEKQPIKAPSAHKLGSSDKDLLSLDLAKEQLKHISNGAYVPLFTSTTGVSKFLNAHSSSMQSAGKCVMCEIDTSKLKGTKLYKVSDIAPRMGVVAAKPMPDYLARGAIPKEAIKQIS